MTTVDQYPPAYRNTTPNFSYPYSQPQNPQQIQQPQQYPQNPQQPQQTQGYQQQYPFTQPNRQSLQNVHMKNFGPLEQSCSMIIKYVSVTNYEQMLSNRQYGNNSTGGEKDDVNDKQMLKRLQKLKPELLKDPVFEFVAKIQPQNIIYQIWKHPSELDRFIKQMTSEIHAMRKFQKRQGPDGADIIKRFTDLSRHVNKWTVSEMPQLTQFLNRTAYHPFLRKSVVFLTFVEHCMPIYLWNIKVYQQVAIYKSPNIISKLFQNQDSKKQIQQFLTVTGDGIIMTTKNPLDTKVQRMVPFTNQFTYSSQIKSDDQLYFTISSCTHESVIVNFQKDYVGGINFHQGIKRALTQSGYIDENRFFSFSKPRKNCFTKLYNDGAGYFNDMCEELNKARKQVCITDWWMTPYFLLRRGTQPNGDTNIHSTTYRLDGLLKKLADRGVKIFIILFREPLGLICNDSYDCQLYLQSLSRNIRMRRHPITPQLWSHHQKCMIIDQRIGFMGGLDLCYGRWDTPDHHILNHNNQWDGGDYVNERLRAYLPGTTKNYDQGPIDRKIQPRMPWHDIGIQLRGDGVIDLTRHFVQYWYFVDAQRVKDPYNHLRNVQRRYDRASTYDYPEWEETGVDQTGKRERGCGEKVALCGTRTNLFITGTQKRLPQLLVQAREGKIRGTQQLQLCRSASTWSIGARNYEQSIHNAYQTLIKQSKNHIYIENQFFMGTENKIVQCIAARIRQAYNNSQNFRIIVVMPLLPGFQGDISKRENGPLRVQVHNQFQSINRGKNSIHSRLKDLPNLNIDDYIFFFGLRNHAKLNDRPLTQIIYVHSKLMIVDDRRAIIGSANINDRSLCGNRDSQLAIVIEENNGEDYNNNNVNNMNNNNNNVNNNGIFDLRRRLYEQHFGLTAQQSLNITHPQIWSKIINTAKKNTLIYRQLFGCYPDDTITVSDQVEQRAKQSKPQLYDLRKGEIFAHAVEFPLHFMEDENLQFQFGDKEGLLGMDAFL